MNPARRLTKPVVMSLFVLFLTVQLTIATAALFEPRPARWSWQMYSGVKTQAAFTIVRANGDLGDVVYTDYMGNPRLDIELSQHLPAHICRSEPDATAVRITAALNDSVTEIRCER